MNEVGKVQHSPRWETPGVRPHHCCSVDISRTLHLFWWCSNLEGFDIIKGRKCHGSAPEILTVLSFYFVFSSPASTECLQFVPNEDSWSPWTERGEGVPWWTGDRGRVGRKGTRNSSTPYLICNQSYFLFAYKMNGYCVFPSSTGRSRHQRSDG